MSIDQPKEAVVLDPNDLDDGKYTAAEQIHIVTGPKDVMARATPGNTSAITIPEGLRFQITGGASKIITFDNGLTVHVNTHSFPDKVKVFEE